MAARLRAVQLCYPSCGPALLDAVGAGRWTWGAFGSRSWSSTANGASTGEGGAVPSAVDAGTATGLLQSLSSSAVMAEVERLRQKASAVPYTQLQQSAVAASGLPPEEVDVALQALARGGALLVHHRVAYLRPWEVAAALHSALPGVSLAPAEAQQRLKQMQQEVEELKAKDRQLRSGAKRKLALLSWGGLAVLAAQWGVLFRLTFFDLSWDVMEPISFFVVSGTSTFLNYLWWMWTRQDFPVQGFTYAEAEQTFTTRWEAKSFARAGYNPQTLSAARQEVERLTALVDATKKGQ